jgi:hypothetical protein
MRKPPTGPGAVGEYHSLIDIETFTAKWSASGGAERANKDAFLLDLCVLLGVSRPDPATGDPELDRYTFERDALIVDEGEKRSIGKMDLYKEGCFVLEAKQGSDEGSKKVGSARRHTGSWIIAMQSAEGQARNYARTIPTPPPFSSSATSASASTSSPRSTVPPPTARSPTRSTTGSSWPTWAAAWTSSEPFSPTRSHSTPRAARPP